MVPRLLSLSLAAQCCRTPSNASSLSPLTALLANLSLQSPSQQTRYASVLSRLSNNPGAVKKRKRVGRGPSSGHGKTSGRGHKGQGQHGKVNPWFQGGQTPLIVQKGRHGFDNLRAPVMSEVNLDKLQSWIDQGRIDPTKRITPKELIESRLVGSVRDGIKLLARGKMSLKQPIDIVASRASAGAIEGIERTGGKVLTRYYTKLSMRRLLSGESVHTDLPLPQGKEYVEKIVDEARKTRFRYRLPDPTSREDIEYYRDPAHRGYLSHQLKEGESPSLYFRVPSKEKVKKVEAEEVKKPKEESMW